MNLMRVIYDHQIFTWQNYGGISRYFCELMDQLSIDPSIQYTLALRYSNNENIRQRSSLISHWSGKSIFWSGWPSQISHLFKNTTQRVDPLNVFRINKLESVRLLKKKEFDLFHPTYYDPYFLKHLGKKPFVLTVHDMIHEIYPTCFSRWDILKKGWKMQLIENADAIIAISKNTREDIIRLTNADPDRISVIYHGNPFESLKPLHSDRTDQAPTKKKYLLFVGNRAGYKNFDFFIRSVAGLLKKDSELSVLCAGGGPFSQRELHLLQYLGIFSKVHYVPIDEPTLRSLYENAQAFVFPSLYEGFGFPLLEAFSCGCPVIASNSSSLPEIAGEAARYFDPENADSLVQGIDAILSDSRYRDSLIRKGYDRRNFFSWKKTAQETKQVYRDLLS